MSQSMNVFAARVPHRRLPPRPRSSYSEEVAERSSRRCGPMETTSIPILPEDRRLSLGSYADKSSSVMIHLTFVFPRRFSSRPLLIKPGALSRRSHRVFSPGLLENQMSRRTGLGRHRGRRLLSASENLLRLVIEIFPTIAAPFSEPRRNGILCAQARWDE